MCSLCARTLALLRTSSACLPVAVSSTRKSMACTNRADGKTLSPSARYVPARKPAFATSSTSSLSAWSCRNIAARHESIQDGVCLALTNVVLLLAATILKTLGDFVRKIVCAKLIQKLEFPDATAQPSTKLVLGGLKIEGESSQPR